MVEGREKMIGEMNKIAFDLESEVTKIEEYLCVCSEADSVKINELLSEVKFLPAKIRYCSRDAQSSVSVNSGRVSNLSGS